MSASDIPEKPPAGARPAINTRTQQDLAQRAKALTPYLGPMNNAANTYAPDFSKVGLQLNTHRVMAVAMQEASPKDPTGTISADGGMGIMQLTPFKGQLTPKVASAIGWDNNADASTNIKNSTWSDEQDNINAGTLTLLDKAQRIASQRPDEWNAMNQDQRWAAVYYAYNHGEGNAYKAIDASQAASDTTYSSIAHDAYVSGVATKETYLQTFGPLAAGTTTQAKSEYDP